ncbi:MAG: hypothetical protein O3B13_15555 [Planctomycetota bacterium]|nr:hypothetical protein [Planctomycetota bacterium]MDA1164509.1 hypothetical protein [Planctomycetota bacterium]
MSDPAHPLTLWLARGSMACYALAVLMAPSQQKSSARGFRNWRAVWSAACVLLVVHVLAAFHFEHGWSHSAAWNHTSEQTARVTGIVWGGGLYFNYAFLILWIVDVAVLWRSNPQTTSLLRRLTDLTCIFMVVNATVIFGPSGWIWPAIAFGLLLVLSDRKHRLRNREVPSND